MSDDSLELMARLADTTIRLQGELQAQEVMIGALVALTMDIDPMLVPKLAERLDQSLGYVKPGMPAAMQEVFLAKMRAYKTFLP